jgi:glycerophosphoryl diester phosphodiesterase
MFIKATFFSSLLLSLASAAPAPSSLGSRNHNVPSDEIVLAVKNVQTGVRPYYLVRNMTDSSLKTKLESCYEDPIKATQFAISHRGAPLQFPEHTMEGVQAAARQGAGVIECDVSFTSDRQLVCRHSQCDLHTTTNILLHPELAAKCTKSFTPASNGTSASANCCTSDITLAEFKSLCGKQDGFNASAVTPQDYQHGTPNWRTELYDTCDTVMSHKEYIQAVDSLGVSFTSEAKESLVPMPFEGNYTRADFTQQIIDEFRSANIHPSRVWLQSFLLDDVVRWVRTEPEFGAQAIYLDDRVNTAAGYQIAVQGMNNLTDQGIVIVAPSFNYLLAVDNSTKEIVPSTYAVAARAAGLKIITWSIERSGPLANVAANKDSYYTTLYSAIKTDGQLYEVIDALAQKVKVLGIFADWPATVTYYASCMGLKGGFQDKDRN